MDYFLGLYAKYIEPIADTYAYCLLRNHFHFLVRIRGRRSNPESLGDLRRLITPSQAFANLFDAYAKAINKRYEQTGSLFQHPFGRIPVTSDEYFVHLIHYIHFNPQRHGFVDDFRGYPYSSYRALCSSSASRIRREEVLSWFGGRESFVHVHTLPLAQQRIAELIGDD